MKRDVQFYQISDRALTVSFGNVISEEINRKVTALAEAVGKKPFPGFQESVPAFSSLTVFYDLKKVRDSFPESETAFAAVRRQMENLLERLETGGPSQTRLVEIEFSCDQRLALDLEQAAASKNLSPEEFIEIFTSRVYRVFMLGFLPGFAYMGEVDPRIAVGRKEQPRKSVPAGSVGIAGSQTGIYPLDSPGGWQIIGRTDVRLFTPENSEPTFLKPGDSVKFTACR